MKKLIIPVAIYTATFIVLNVGMYFLLRMTQPKSELLADAAKADSSVVERSEHAEEGALDSASVQEHNADSLSVGSETESELHGRGKEEQPTTTGNTSEPKSGVGSRTKSDEPQATGEASSITGEHSEPLVEADSASTDEVNEESVLTATPTSTAEITKLAKLLEGMKPNEAAVIAERLPTETIVQLVMRMKSRSGAKMMASLPVPVAASVATRMAELSGVKNPS